ncbi:MAG: hypothetical protein ACYDDF_10485 [Thermoplasmatota archaeon]
MLVGAMALQAWGMPRSSLDIDFVIAVKEEPDYPDHKFLGYPIEELATDPVFSQRVVILLDPPAGFPFELFIARHRFTIQALKRRKTVSSALLGRDVEVVSPEDFILSKLCFTTMPDRSARKVAQDGIDIDNVIERNDSLDLGYLRRTADELGVLGRLDEFFREPEPGPGHITRTKCGSRCRGATSAAKDCHCECGGGNHGSGLRARH